MSKQKKSCMFALTWNGIVNDETFFRVLIVFHIEYLDLFLFLFGRFDGFGCGQCFIAFFNDNFDNRFGSFDILWLLMLWMVWIISEAVWWLHRIGGSKALNIIWIWYWRGGSMRIILLMMMCMWMMGMVLIDLEWHRFIARRWCIIGCYSPLDRWLRWILMEIAELSLVTRIIYCDFFGFWTKLYIVRTHNGIQNTARRQNLK